MSRFISTWLLGLKTGVKMIKRVMFTVTSKIKVRLVCLFCAKNGLFTPSQLKYTKQKG